MDEKIPVGISSCLLGQEVRYNGGHTRSKYCVNHLSRIFEFVAFCPEVAIGLGIPREPIRMIGAIDAPRVVGTVTTELDVTDALVDYAHTVAGQAENFCGYIFMKNSPSCGLYSTKIYNDKNNLPGKHAGMFTRTLRQLLPLLPVEEDGRLNDAVLRENFIAQVFAYHDWRVNVQNAAAAKKIVDYHSRYKYLIMAHNQSAYRQLGRMVAKSGIGDIESLAQKYIELFMKTVRKPANRRGHSNALYHLLGYLRDGVPGKVRQDIANHIEEYRVGIVNLAVPMSIMDHYLKLYGSEYVNRQAYLAPYSKDLGLRNNI